MAIQIKIGTPTNQVDYTRYVEDGTLKVEDSLNVPNLCNFTMANIDNLFVVPVRNSYVTVFSTKESRYLFTGFITSVPEISHLGSGANSPSTNFQRQRYAVQATSDEYLLNIKSIPFVPAFVNQTMGQILANLANVLAPGFFDTSRIQGGDLIPYFQYDPTQKWSDLCKTFADAARFYYQVVNKQIIFEQYSSTSLGVAYDETAGQGTFDPYSLQTGLLTVPPINDAIVIGDVEPQEVHDDYFIGDGVTSNFPLRHAMFRGSSQLLLQEDWTGQSIGSSWTEFDPQNVISEGSGALVVQMSASGALGTEYVQGVNGVELGGHLDLQHGEFFFTGLCTGILGGVYSTSPPTLGSCLLGFQVSTPSVGVTVTFSGASGLQIQPILNGALLPASSPVTTQINHHYFLETFVTARRWSRYDQIYRTLAGTAFGDTQLPAQAEITFIIWDINLQSPETPIPTKYYTTASLPSFGLYVPVNAQLLNLTLNYTLLNQPPQGLLTVQSLYGPTGLNMPIKTPGPAEPYNLGFGFGQQVATIAAAGQAQNAQSATPDALQFYAGSLSNLNTWVGGTVPAAGARIHLRSWSAGKSLARVQDPFSIASEAVIVGDNGLRTGIFADLNPLPRTSEESALAASATILDREFAQYDGQYTIYDYFRDKTQDFPRSGRNIPVNSPTRGIGLQQIASDNFYRPNGPVTTGWALASSGSNAFQITNSRARASVLSVASDMYFSGASFPTNQYSQVQIMTDADASSSVSVQVWIQSNPSSGGRTCYEWVSAPLGVQGGKLQTVVNGVVTLISNTFVTLKKGDLVRLAISVQISTSTFPGSSTPTLALYQNGALVSFGGVITLSPGGSPGFAISSSTGLGNAEVGNWSGGAVTPTIFLVRSINTSVESLPDEVVVATIEFGQDLFVEKLLKRFLPNQTNILEPQDAAVTPPPQTLNNLGTMYTSDLLDVSVLAISGGNVYVDLGTIPVTGAEIRRVDNGWGISPQGLIATVTSRFVTLQRQQYEQIWYIRQVNGGAVSRFSRVIRVVYPQVPAPPYAVANITDPLRPIISVGLTGDLRNLRFTEIRDSDNVTVLYQQTFASYADLIFTYDNTVALKRNFSWFVYFSDLMYEYSSPAFNLQFSIPPPACTLVVDSESVNLAVSVSGIQVNRIDFVCYKDAALTIFAASGSQAVNFAVSGSIVNGAAVTFPLTVDDAVGQRWFVARGTDALGVGPFCPALSHIYTSLGLVSFDNTNNVLEVAVPPNPNTDPAVPTPLTQYSGDYVAESWNLYVKGINRQYR